jgi:hypothetical protein
MKTISVNLYSFSELSEKAQKKLIQQRRRLEENDSQPFYVDEACKTLEEFCDIFNVKYRNIDFMAPYRNEYTFDQNDNVRELRGHRLAKYIWNNFGNQIFKKKYYGSLSGVQDKKVEHKRLKSNFINSGPNKGKFGHYYYSAITVTNDGCPLTGVYYDCEILDPMIKFLDNPTDRYDFSDIIENCISSLCEAVQKEYEYRCSDECIKEELSDDGQMYLEDGTEFTNL